MIDKYLFQAIDTYPYDLQETVESLQYALSYNPNKKNLVLKNLKRKRNNITPMK